MNCIDCASWNLKGSPMRSVGMGLCKAAPTPAVKAAHTFAPGNLCRFKQFSQAGQDVVEARERALDANTKAQKTYTSGVTCTEIGGIRT